MSWRTAGNGAAIRRFPLKAHCRLFHGSAPVFYPKLPSEAERQRPEWSKWLNSRMDSLQTAVFTFGQTLNDATGYSAIENLKQRIEAQEMQVVSTRERLREAKDRYTEAVNSRSMSQREVNELLQRKNNWSTNDLERFTELYRNDHKNETEEATAEKEMSDAEEEFEDGQAKLTSLISARYHEEQIWSDKIRRASTWGTWGLMGFNIILFVVVQLGLEPWRRRRLVGNFEDKVKEALKDWDGNSSSAVVGVDPESGDNVDGISAVHEDIEGNNDASNNSNVPGNIATLPMRLSQETVVASRLEIGLVAVLASLVSMMVGMTIGIYGK